jgi:p-cumate 2,3-dioxygenase beta subunit
MFSPFPIAEILPGAIADSPPQRRRYAAMNAVSHDVTRSDIEDFLYREAAYLDAWDLDAWIGLYARDARYCVPSTDKPDGDPIKDMVIVDDDRERLESRVERLKSRRAHREFPLSRTRHQVSNVIVERRDGDAIYVSAGFTVWRFRGARADYYVGRYDYEFALTGDGMKVRSKRATLDLTTLDEAGAVSIIL